MERRLIGKNDNEQEENPANFNNLKLVGLTTDLLEDWLFILSVKNNKNMKDTAGKQGLFKSGHVAEFIFLVCEKLQLSSDVKYLAIEIFDRFMVKHIEDLYEHVISVSEVKNRKSDWKSILARVQNQMSLRATSCIQISSKLNSHYKVITSRKAKLLLKEAGHIYSTEGILNSELRILKTLDYQVNFLSPIVYVELLLEILGHNDSNINVQLLYKFSLKILDIVYLKRQHVYSNLFTVATGAQMTPLDRIKFSPVENDMMLLTASIIACAAFIIDSRFAYKIVEHLYHITAIPEADINDFTTVLMNILSIQP